MEEADRDDWWPRWVWVGECFFWYQLTQVVPDEIHRAVKRFCFVYVRCILKLTRSSGPGGVCCVVVDAVRFEESDDDICTRDREVQNMLKKASAAFFAYKKRRHLRVCSCYTDLHCCSKNRTTVTFSNNFNFVCMGVTLVWKVGDQARDAEKLPRIEMPKASSGVENGERAHCLPSWLGVLGERLKLPQQGPGILELSKYVVSHIANFGQSCMNIVRCF